VAGFPRFFAAALAIALLATGDRAHAQDAVSFFKQNCVSCHTIGGGPLSGPDLKGVTARQDRGWLHRFLLDPPAVITSGDPYAAKLLQAARGVMMPRVAGMTPAMADALLAMIDVESALEKSQFVGVQISARPLTPADVAQGRRIFFGEAPLLGGGAACLSCHSVRGTQALGGGRLGPDLTKVYERLQGRTPLATWLSAPPTPTMQATYRQNPMQPDDVLGMVAFFEDQAKQGSEEAWPGATRFLLFGLGGTVLALFAFDGAWRRRFRAVRRPLVHGSPDGGGRWR
jgi:mono/diheme cytochrome c family protein